MIGGEALVASTLLGQRREQESAGDESWSRPGGWRERGGNIQGKYEEAGHDHVEAPWRRAVPVLEKDSFVGPVVVLL